MTITEFMTVEEVAKRTFSPLSTIQHWIYTGKLASVKIGRRRLVPVEAYLALVAAGSHPVASGGGR